VFSLRYELGFMSQKTELFIDHRGKLRFYKVYLLLPAPPMTISSSTVETWTRAKNKAAFLGTTSLQAAPPDSRCSWRRYLKGTPLERAKLTPTELGLICFFQSFASTSQITVTTFSLRFRFFLPCCHFGNWDAI
jgi:hypothetical protein